jgi:hypothetical protein
MFLNSNTSLSMYLFCNSRIHVIKQRCQGIVTVVAVGCGPMVNLRFGRRLGSPPREQQPSTSHLRPMRDLVLLSTSILILLPLCF